MDAYGDVLVHLAFLGVLVKFLYKLDPRAAIGPHNALPSSENGTGPL